MAQKFLVGGEWRESNETLDVIFPFDERVIDSIFIPAEKDMEEAIEKAQKGFELTRRLPTYRRTEILYNLHRLMQENFEQLVETMIVESGKTYKTATGETARACQTVRVAAEEAGRLYGEVIDLDWTPPGANHQGFVRHFPVGIVLGITPFNYPLNLACHKLAPAIATGNAFILKPPEIAPLSSLLLAELVLTAGFPPEALSILPVYGTQAEKMVQDSRIAMLSFTGSARVGWMLKNKAGRKKVALELGGNAPAIIHEDANLAVAVQKTVNGGFTNAGQNCISVQRLLLHRPIFEDFCDHYLPAVEALKVGDPRDETTDIGPMIHLQAAERAEEWVEEALANGATALLRGKREGTLFAPVILSDVKPQMRVCREEVFAPVVTLLPYETWDEAIRIANDSEFGLQAGVFTNDLDRMMDAWERLEVGGVQINDASTFRVDHMPYGGVKASGLGREGLRYAMREMTEMRLMVINREQA